MSARDLLNLSSEFGGLSSMFLLFRNEFNTFNKTGARMLDFIYCMTLK